MENGIRIDDPFYAAIRSNSYFWNTDQNFGKFAKYEAIAKRNRRKVSPQLKQ